jgi:hypothetical protein
MAVDEWHDSNGEKQEDEWKNHERIDRGGVRCFVCERK